MEKFTARHYAVLAVSLPIAGVLGVAAAIGLWLTVMPMVDPIARAIALVGGAL